MKGQLTRIQPIVPPMRIVPNCLAGSRRLANAMALATDIDGTYITLKTRKAPKNGQKSVRKAQASSAAPPSSCTVQSRSSIECTSPDSRLFSPMKCATKEFCGCSYRRSGASICWITPSLNTATRSDMVSASLWSCVT